jgi:hypothetical protein
MFIKLFILFFLIVGNSFAITIDEAKDFYAIDFYDFILRYKINRKNYVSGITKGKKIDISSLGSASSLGLATYIQPAEKYSAYLEYRGNIRELSVQSKSFLNEWFKLANFSNNSIDNNSYLPNQNFNLYFVLSSFSVAGRNYNFIVQKTISNLLKNSVKNGELIKVYLLNIGENEFEEPIFILLSFEKVKEALKIVKNKTNLEDSLKKIEADILAEKFDKAKGNLEILLKTYPNNIALKLNLCSAFNGLKNYINSISCYNEILKKEPENYEALYGISLAIYNSSNVELKNNAKQIIDFTSVVIKEIEKISQKSARITMLNINSHYLRAMAKISLNNKSAINDLEFIAEEQPEIIGSDIVEIYKKQLEF